MKLSTAIRLLNNNVKEDTQLFFGNLRIYTSFGIIASMGVGSFLNSSEYELLKQHEVVKVEWFCHEHMWVFYIK